MNKFIDMSVWTGSWPFTWLRYGDLDLLREKLKSMNVVKAFISPIEGILEQDPMRANISLLARLKDSFFSPVPIIDLSYGNWQECMNIATCDGRVRMVKLLPNYHRYKLGACRLDSLVEAAQEHKMIISIQMRVEDKRTQYPLMKVNDVEVHDVICALSRFPAQTFIINNALMSEIGYMLDSLENVRFDIPFLERQDTLEYISSMYPLDRFLFSSHCPFFFPEGSLSKLSKSSLDIKELEKVAYKNAEKLLI